MTFEEKKLWLERYGKTKRKIQYLRLRKEEVEALYLPHSSIAAAEVKRKSKGTGLDTYAAAIDDIERDIMAAVDQAEEILSEIYTALDKVKNNLYVDAILQIYVKDCSIKQFSINKGYSKRHAERIHNEAVKCLEIG